MKILAIDTSTEACSVAVKVDDKIIEQHEIIPRKHTERIIPMIESLLTETGTGLESLDCLAYGCGPGAFTGVRIATGVIQGLAFAHDLPVVAISSLAALAAGAKHKDCHIFTAIDARMNEIYYACYVYNPAAATYELVGREGVSSVSKAIIPEADQFYGIGTGWLRYKDDLQERFGDKLIGFEAEQYPHASAILELAVTAYEGGHVLDAAQVFPNYLRNKVV